jgi:hypothetical protein
MSKVYNQSKIIRSSDSDKITALLFENARLRNTATELMLEIGMLREALRSKTSARTPRDLLSDRH